MFSYFGLFLANFDYFGLIFGREHQKCTFSDPLGLIRTMESKTLGSPGDPEPTLSPKTKIGVNTSHVVQLTGFGPKKQI